MADIEKTERKVSWTYFAWAMAIVLMMAGWFFTQISTLNTKIDAAMVQSNKIEVQLSQIQTDIQWIKVNIVK